MKHLFPCEKCGETHEIDTSQAGQHISCRCGQVLEVPSLRGIRELEPVVEMATAAPRQAWNLGRGCAFAAGILLALGGAAVVIFACMFRAQIRIPERPVYKAEQVEADIDAWSPRQAWDAWGEIREQGLGRYRPPAHHLARQALERTELLIIVGSIAGLFGVVAAAGAVLFRGGKPK
jgi:hypothetical protein